MSLIKTPMIDFLASRYQSREEAHQALAILKAVGRTGEIASQEAWQRLELAQLSFTPTVRSVKNWLYSMRDQGILDGEELEIDEDYDDLIREISTGKEWRNFVDVKPRSNGVVRRKTVKPERYGSEKILILDIETLPAIIHDYSLWSNFTSHKNVLVPGRMISWAAKFVGDPYNARYYMDLRRGYTEMLEGLWKLMDAANYIVTWNGNRFDIPKIQGFFVREGMALPSPAKSIDLMVSARKLGFESKALDYVARMYQTDRKVAGAGAAGYQECLGMNEDGTTPMERLMRLADPEAAVKHLTEDQEEAFKKFREYNLGDIQATEALFFEMMPLIKGISFFEDGCPMCGSTEAHEAGHHTTPASSWQALRCTECSFLYRVGKSRRRSPMTLARPL